MNAGASIRPKASVGQPRHRDPFAPAAAADIRSGLRHCWSIDDLLRIGRARRNARHLRNDTDRAAVCDSRRPLADTGASPRWTQSAADRTSRCPVGPGDITSRPPQFATRR